MIERYTIHATPEEITNRFQVEVDDYYLPSYNAAPTQKLPVIVNKAKGGLSYLHWGANPNWSNNKSISVKLISAPTEHLFSKATLKSALKSNRCMIPVTGFYLWKQVGKKSLRPYYFKIDNEALFGIAGLWEEYEDLEGKTNYTFKIITVKNNLVESGFGNELPFILNQSMESDWLSGNSILDAEASLMNYQQSPKFNYYIVAPHISNIKINSSNLIKPQPPVDQLGNFTLFE